MKYNVARISFLKSSLLLIESNDRIGYLGHTNIVVIIIRTTQPLRLIKVTSFGRGLYRGREEMQRDSQRFMKTIKKNKRTMNTFEKITPILYNIYVCTMVIVE